MRVLVPLAILLAVGVLAYALLSDGLSTNGSGEIDEFDFNDPQAHNPELHGTEDARRRKTVTPVEQGTPAIPSAELPPKERTNLEAIHGTVLHALSREPLAGITVWTEPHQDPCPRLPSLHVPEAGITDGGVISMPLRVGKQQGKGVKLAKTNEQGAFRIESALVEGARCDVFAAGEGHIANVVCNVDASAPVIIHLTPGTSVRGTIWDPSKRPIEKARVVVSPAKGMPPELGFYAHAKSNKDGVYTLNGLQKAPVMIKVEHPEFMPTVAGPFTPDANKQMDFTLTPAMRIRFEVRSNDGRNIADPLVQWEIPRKPGVKGAAILSIDAAATAELTGEETEDTSPTSQFISKSIRVPCGLGPALLRVSAKGYAEWRSAEIAMPVEGGERTIQVSLRRDAARGGARFTFQKEDGERVSYVSMGAEIRVGLTDEHAQPGESGVLTQRMSSDLELGGMAEGSYRLIILSPEFAPVEVDFRASSAESEPIAVTLTPAAKIKIRFNATEQAAVKFRLTQDGEITQAVPIGARKEADPEAGLDRTMVVFGSDVATFGGLASGRYTIEVINDNLHATPRTVELTASETTEIEIPVTAR